ncbi:MAG: 5-(carboxyamino)imidazole ribonucleotide mutase [Alkaliphilus sp.]|nr:5-(carboxyamino)imidazole ribonucleotide mutase [bacterium AH-315-L21]MBN4067588.1 5-(carboxyamino)imidazole ribonucleotide mutase [Alkaliphilus transvaalensis]PHS33882.1 MAG: 5-(carboxyamino)imidazole ribonucleotide mutase [Alkaliphilus sp.]
MGKPIVSIIMGSDSDLSVMQEAAKLLEEFEISYEISIVSAHRTPDRLYKYAKEVDTRGVKVIIAGAGGAAHLPGMVASLTVLPIIGVPIKSKAMNGIDSLYSIVQMPGGVPVASMAINGAKNAAIFAAEIIGISNSTVKERLLKYKEDMRIMVEEMKC